MQRIGDIQLAKSSPLTSLAQLGSEDLPSFEIETHAASLIPLQDIPIRNIFGTCSVLLWGKGMNSRSNFLLGVLAALGVVLLAGCATPEERYRQAQQKAAAEAAAADNYRRGLESRCRGYGFQQNTPQFSQCVMQVDQSARQALAANKAREEQESRCQLAQAQACLSAGRSDCFQAYNNCMAGIPPPQPVNLICRRDAHDQVVCSNQ